MADGKMGGPRVFPKHVCIHALTIDYFPGLDRRKGRLDYVAIYRYDNENTFLFFPPFLS